MGESEIVSPIIPREEKGGMNNLGGWRDRPPPSLAFFLFLDCHLLLSPPLCIVSLPLLWVTGSGLAGSYPPLQPRQPRSFKNFPIETSTYRRGTSKTDFTASLPLSGELT